MVLLGCSAAAAAAAGLLLPTMTAKRCTCARMRGTQTRKSVYFCDDGIVVTYLRSSADVSVPRLAGFSPDHLFTLSK